MVLLTAIAWNIAWFVLQAADVPYAMRTLGMDASAVGVTLACYGAGMVVGALLAKSAIGAMMERVSSIFLAVNSGARPVGAAIGAWVGAAWGEPACLVLALVGFVVQAAIIFASPFRALERLPSPAT